MNKMEAAWCQQLQLAMAVGDILWVGKHGAVTLKLAPDTRYTPDFVFMNKNGDLVFDEVKGFMEDDAWVKLKVAAALFPMRFRLITRKGKQWQVKEVGDGDLPA